jgi:hypothetical protein
MLQQPIFGNSFLTPWREMARWQQEMNRLFSGVPSPTNGHTATGYPAMNILTNQEGAVVTAELPGIDLDNIDISITGDILTLTGSRQPGQLPEGAKYHRQERGLANSAGPSAYPSRSRWARLRRFSRMAYCTSPCLAPKRTNLRRLPLMLLMPNDYLCSRIRKRR